MNPSAFRAPAVVIVALVLMAETLVLLGLSGFLIYQLVVDTPDAIASAVGLVLIALAATAWIALTTIGFVQGRAFARGSTLVWQVLQGAVGLASNQGLFARPDIASGLLVPALIALALLLFSPSVSKHLRTARDAP
jgi:hypothetical protein